MNRIGWLVGVVVLVGVLAIPFGVVAVEPVIPSRLIPNPAVNVCNWNNGLETCSLAATSLEGLRTTDNQGLSVYEAADVDDSLFQWTGLPDLSRLEAQLIVTSRLIAAENFNFQFLSCGTSTFSTMFTITAATPRTDTVTQVPATGLCGNATFTIKIRDAVDGGGGNSVLVDRLVLTWGETTSSTAASFACYSVVVFMLCHDTTDYTGKSPVSLDWYTENRRVASSSPGGWVWLLDGTPLSDWTTSSVSVGMQTHLNNQQGGGPWATHSVPINSWLKPFLWLGLFTLYVLAFLAVWQRRKLYLEPTPRYQHLGSKTEDDSGYMTSAVRSSERYNRFLTFKDSIDGRKVTVRYGIRAASRPERARLGKRWIGEVVSVRERVA